MKRAWDKLSMLSKVNSMHLYKNHDKKYYIIGNKKNELACENILCDELNQFPVGTKCSTIEALIDNWLTYNNSYNITTNFYLDVKDEKLMNHFKLASQACYHRDKKCILYPNVNVFITHYALYELLMTVKTLDINTNVDNVINKYMLYMTELINNYQLLGIYIFNDDKFDNDIIKFKYLNQNLDINKHIKAYGQPLYENYLNQLKYIHHINDGEFFLITQNITDNQELWKNFIIFTEHYINILKPLFTILNNMEILSHMVVDINSTHILFTDDPEFFTEFFTERNLKDYLNLVNESNCLKFTSQQIQGDEYRWYRFKNLKPQKEVMIKKIFNFNLSIRPQRGGVIMYTSQRRTSSTMTNNTLYFGFGVDAIYNELTDFGGHLDRSDKNVIEGALRECREESLGVLNFTYKNVLEDLILYDDKMAILLVKTQESMDKINLNFKNKLTRKKVEVNDIVWLSLDELKHELSMTHSRIYNRVKDLLIRAGEFYKLL